MEIDDYEPDHYEKHWYLDLEDHGLRTSCTVPRAVFWLLCKMGRDTESGASVMFESREQAIVALRRAFAARNEC